MHWGLGSSQVPSIKSLTPPRGLLDPITSRGPPPNTSRGERGAQSQPRGADHPGARSRRPADGLVSLSQRHCPPLVKQPLKPSVTGRPHWPYKQVTREGTRVSLPHPMAVPPFARESPPHPDLWPPRPEAQPGSLGTLPLPPTPRPTTLPVLRGWFP